MLLPLLIGAGVLLLVATSGREAEKDARDVYAGALAAGQAGQKFGIAQRASGAAEMSQSQVMDLPAAKASGYPQQYYTGYKNGYLTKIAPVGGSATSGKTPGGKVTLPKPPPGKGVASSCVDTEAAAMHTLLQYQQALVNAGSLAAKSSAGKNNADGLCGPTTQAAIRDFQAKRSLPASGTVDKATAWQLETYMTIGTGTGGATGDSGSGSRSPVTYQMVRSADQPGAGPAGQYAITGGADSGYVAMIDAVREPDGFYKITKVYSDATGSIVANFDRGWLWVPAGDGTWVEG